MESYDGSLNKIEVLTNIFTIDKGIIKILLVKKEKEPYKGYWMLPRRILDRETIEECSQELVMQKIGFRNMEFEINNVYSDPKRVLEQRVIGISTIGVVDSVTVHFHREEIDTIETKWFEVTSLPKTIYDHAEIILEASKCFKKNLSEMKTLKKLFPSDFTLPELQKVYEQALDHPLDRRNFRKKFVSLDILEPTGDKNIGYNGRPAKLYRFKEEIKDKTLF